MHVLARKRPQSRQHVVLSIRFRSSHERREVTLSEESTCLALRPPSGWPKWAGGSDGARHPSRDRSPHQVKDIGHSGKRHLTAVVPFTTGERQTVPEEGHEGTADARGASRTGVLFVHGIGEQRQSESVRWFAAPLLEWLSQWHVARALAQPEITAAGLSYGADLEGPARITLRLPSVGGHATEWVFAESWWAARIDPPGLGEMLAWSRRSAGRALARLRGELGDRIRLVLARLLGQSVQRPVARSDPGLLAAVAELLNALVLFGAYLLASPAIAVAVVALSLVALLPFPQTRQFALVQRLETFLLTGLGDFRTYLEDDVQGVHIRQRVLDDLTWLIDEEACTEVVLVAHSQGTVVAFDALTAGDPKHTARVTKFLTVGAALNAAWTLGASCRRVLGTLPSHIYWLDFFSYYDPVPGGQMRRAVAGASPLVAPTQALREEMRWFEENVYRSVPYGSEAPPSAPLPREVTNSMSVLTDHDGYWRNPEQFIARLAAEIDTPRAYYKRSRFSLQDSVQSEVSRRRRVRVITLVSWRLIAALGFVLALAARVDRAGPSQLVREGEGIASLLRLVPGVELLGALPASVATLAQRLRELADGAPLALGQALRAVADGLAWEGWSALWHSLLALMLYGAAFALVYVVLARVLWRPWDERERRETALPQLPAWRAPRWRWTAVVAGAVAVLVLVARNA